MAEEVPTSGTLKVQVEVPGFAPLVLLAEPARYGLGDGGKAEGLRQINRLRDLADELERLVYVEFGD